MKQSYAQQAKQGTLGAHKIHSETVPDDKRGEARTLEDVAAMIETVYLDAVPVMVADEVYRDMQIKVLKILKKSVILLESN